MPHFLSRQELYRMLQRELPEDVYPDHGVSSTFFSTAESDSVADVVASGYANLERVYVNTFPQTADEQLTDWEITAFGQPLDAALSVAQRQDLVVQKIRARKGLTKKDMIDIAKSVLGSDALVDVSEWGCNTGGWVLDVSELDISTILNGANLLAAVGPDLCANSPSDYGLTPEEWQEMQEEAYTYQLNIYGQIITAQQRFDIDQQLSIYEPARSRHLIVDGLDPEDMIDGPADVPVFFLLEDESGELELENGFLLLME